MMGASMASRASRTSSADASDSSRRNAAMSPVVMPKSATLVARAVAMPLTAVSNATPRATWACGSNMISAWRTPDSCARRR